jgi:hypothetical protein
MSKIELRKGGIYRHKARPQVTLWMILDLWETSCTILIMHIGATQEIYVEPPTGEVLRTDIVAGSVSHEMQALFLPKGWDARCKNCGVYTWPSSIYDDGYCNDCVIVKRTKEVESAPVTQQEINAALELF